MVIIEMQSTGQTSRHDSQPVQLSALIIATSLGSFFLGPALAIYMLNSRDQSWPQIKSCLVLPFRKQRRLTATNTCDFFHKPCNYTPLPVTRQSDSQPHYSVTVPAVRSIVNFLVFC